MIGRKHAEKREAEKDCSAIVFQFLFTIADHCSGSKLEPEFPEAFLR
jgi:hypothetical protein